MTDSSQYISNPFKLLQLGLQALMINLRPLFLLMLFPLAVSIFQMTFKIPNPNSPEALVMAIISNTISIVYFIVITPAMFYLYLASAKGEKKSLREALQWGMPRIFSVWWLSLLEIFVIIAGFVLLVIPGIIFSVWFGFSHYVLVDRGIKGTKAMQESKGLVKGHFWDTILLFLVFSLPFLFLNVIPVIGQVLSSVAGLFAGLVLGPAYAIRYLQLKKMQGAAPTTS